MTSTEAFVCCGKTFTQKGNHKRHIKTVHSARIGMPCGGRLKPRADNVKRHKTQCKTCKCLRRGHPASQNDLETESKTTWMEDNTSPGSSDPIYKESTRVEGFDSRQMDTGPRTADYIQTVRNFVPATLGSAIPVDNGTLIGLIGSIIESQMPSTLLDTTLSNAMGRHMSVGNGSVAEPSDTYTYYDPYTSDNSFHFEDGNGQ
ncbi:hypothetical protein CaCOL14_009918 [Colletotrichum acutatum]|uniref:C2H2-type domain-containing protein n=1 Tax=Glomerella acutata TaxID=27357 RepID=A0AAD8UDP0_GLOAC|nr:uncharacterized protein BDZ83DRAFT_656122 [Colletotrichum acutatum]KAK1714094.1 hypothetical protein BDZ83DRAFT_656122 [Colletotrichum acutatum]